MTAPDSRQTRPQEPSAGWVIWLWLTLCLWVGFITYQAYGELRGGQTVQGLFRIYQPPYQVDEGWVIDPRETPLAQELALRYGDGQTPREDGTDGVFKAWRPILKSLDLRPVDAGSAGPLNRPSLRFIEGRSVPDLWVGRYGEKHVIFRQDVGVIVMETLPRAQRTVTLTEAKNRPW